MFRILTTSLGNKELLGTTGTILGIVFEWLYLATLLTCFVLALGNRPQGSNKFYMTMVYFWVGIMIYLVFASIFITVKSIQISTSDKKFEISDLFTNSLFFTLIVSLASTYVLWFVISFLFFDPWHLFTSVSVLYPNPACCTDVVSSSSNTCSLRLPISIFSMSTLSVTLMTSLGALRATTKPLNSKSST